MNLYKGELMIIPSSGIAVAIQQDLQIPDPTELVAKGIINDARTTRDFPAGYQKDNNPIQLLSN